MKKSLFYLTRIFFFLWLVTFCLVIFSCAKKTSEGFLIPGTGTILHIQKKQYTNKKSSNQSGNIQITREQMDGVASWYGPKFHGKKTANGEFYNQNAFTVAHKILPINTRIKITNRENGRWVQARVNDRGPYKKNRVVDVSKKIAKELKFLEKGTARVRLDIISYPDNYDPKFGIAPYKQKVVQIVSYKDPSRLLENFAKVKKQVHPIAVFADKISNKEYHIVAGPFYSVKNAQFVSEQIRIRGFDSFVRSYRK